VLTNARGEVLRRVLYKPYGEALLPAEPSPNGVPEFGFTGQRFEGGLGIYDYGARFYDPTLGRFLQPDEIVQDPFNPQSLNRFSYVLNSPVNLVDPTGNQSAGYYGETGGPFPQPTGWIDPGISPYASFPGGSRGPGSGPLRHLPMDPASVSARQEAADRIAQWVENHSWQMKRTSSQPTQQLPKLTIPDLQTGDVLLTGDGGLARYLKGTGEYGHAAIVLEARGESLTVLSSDNQGVYIRDNTYSGVGGRSFDVFRVPGINQADLRAYSENLFTGGGLEQYFGDEGANVCSSVCARALEAARGPRVDRSLGGVVTPQSLGRVLGPPIGQVYVPLRSLP
jgi:RHS repeat-associated protein